MSENLQILLKCCTTSLFISGKTVSLLVALRAAQTCRYFVYSEANFEVFRPAGATRCTDCGEIWHGGGDLRSNVLNVSQGRPSVAK